MTDKKETIKQPEAAQAESAKEEKEIPPFKFGTHPSLLINMVRETRVYRFEMPIGAKLEECKEAVLECAKVVDMMIKEAEKKQAEALEKEKSESSDEDNEETNN